MKVDLLPPLRKGEYATYLHSFKEFCLKVALTYKLCTFVASSGTERELFDFSFLSLKDFLCWAQVLLQSAVWDFIPVIIPDAKNRFGQIEQIYGIWSGADCNLGWLDGCIFKKNKIFTTKILSVGALTLLAVFLPYFHLSISQDILLASDVDYYLKNEETFDADSCIQDLWSLGRNAVYVEVQTLNLSSSKEAHSLRRFDSWILNLLAL